MERESETIKNLTFDEINQLIERGRVKRSEELQKWGERFRNNIRALFNFRPHLLECAQQQK